jgi:hypothetical protein
MYFGGNISGQRVFILLCGSEHAAIEIANTEGITEVFGKMHKAHYVDNLIIALRTKMADGTSWTLPLGQIWSKNIF